jgi:AmmeMemoRadiSam system protein B
VSTGAAKSDLVPRVKEPHLAGRWYPAAPAALAAAVAELLAAAGSLVPGVVAVVVPHAAWALSGATAARGFAAAGAGHARAVILGPSHFADFRGAAVLPMGAYRTPLGMVRLDEEASATLARSPLVRSNPALFMREHSIEAQLPFWQTLAPGAPVVPLLVGSLERDEADALAAHLRPLIGPGTLAVVSSDMVHYGRRFGYLPEPPRDAQAVTSVLRRLDDGALARLVARDADGLAGYLAEQGAPVCGRHALGVLLRALPDDVHGATLGRATSVEATGEFEQAVGYAAVAFTRASAG